MTAYSSISVAVCRGYALAMDDRVATKHAFRAFPQIQIRKTQDIVLSLIREGVLSLADADALRDEWQAHHRFTIPIASFREIL